MAEILPFRRPRASDKYKGRDLCRHGHHKWQLDGGSRFDVKQGRLVTRYRCARCGRVKTEAR
jgi:hypothetical protein